MNLLFENKFEKIIKIIPGIDDDSGCCGEAFNQKSLIL